MRFLEAVSGYNDRYDGEVSGYDVVIAIPVVHSEDEDVRGWAKDWAPEAQAPWNRHRLGEQGYCKDMSDTV